jgi:negative regulator of flagellin synthesis FlgM
MKIGQPSDLPALVAQTQAPRAQAQSAAASAQSKKPAAPNGVQVSVSEEALALAQAENNPSNGIDAQKVAMVKAALKDGTYRINPEAIANKLLSNAQDMLRRTVK